MRARLLFAPVLLLIVACASSGGGGGGGNSQLLSAADIQTNVIAGESLWDTIQRMRPQWLSVRPGQPEPVVFIDRVNAGNLQTLRTINSSTVQEARFVPADVATGRFGGVFDGGVIEVVLRQ